VRLKSLRILNHFGLGAQVIVFTIMMMVFGGPPALAQQGTSLSADEATAIATDAYV
jgi:hypothetical protein